MNDDAKPANAMTELDKDVRTFLAGLSPDDVNTLKRGLTLVHRVEGFTFVVKWLVLFFAAVAMMIAGLGDSVSKIASWFKH